MDRLVIYNKMIEVLQKRGFAHKQKDIAERMKSSESNISKAKKGDPKVLNESFLIRLNHAYGNIFNATWITSGEGEMLADTESSVISRINIGDINNSQNVAVGHNNTIADELIERAQELVEPRRTAPLIPIHMMKRAESDLIELAEKVEGLQRIFCGDLDIDAYIYVADDALMPEYYPTDVIGIKAYGEGETIIPDNLYAVNTKSNGMVVRYLKMDEEGNFVAYSRTKDIQPFIIRKEDVIRLYRKIIMFRY